MLPPIGVRFPVVKIRVAVQEEQPMAAAPVEGQHRPEQNAAVPSQHQREFALA
jgi:hypothetical protein